MVDVFEFPWARAVFGRQTAADNLPVLKIKVSDCNNRIYLKEIWL